MTLLDAAVDELIERGYANLTTSAVAYRAGVSRGAQQRYFPHKDLLVADAVHHLAQRQRVELETSLESEPGGRARAGRALDVVFAQYSGRLFAAMIELSLAARHDPELAPIIATEERAISRALNECGARYLGPELARSAGFGRRWSMALATARGVALLSLLGHPPEVVGRQWAFARGRLLRLLLDENESERTSR
ncbi:MAG TPA: helix-turn-helix domain-containing protein [Chloroflexota bacterium]